MKGLMAVLLGASCTLWAQGDLGLPEVEPPDTPVVVSKEPWPYLPFGSATIPVPMAVFKRTPPRVVRQVAPPLATAQRFIPRPTSREIVPQSPISTAAPLPSQSQAPTVIVAPSFPTYSPST